MSGAPESPWRIALSDLDYGPEERAAVLAVLESKWLTMGARVRAFEEGFAAALGVRHAIAVANGTDALMLALLAHGVGPGDEVIQPAVNFVAAANVTLRVGARPVFGEIASLDEPTLDPAAIESLVTPRTRAVVVMHYGGAPCRMEPIAELCRRRRLALIEDACHGVGGALGGRALGAWGDAGAFSFFSNKNLAVGEGGMLTTDRDGLAQALRRLRSHGMTTVTWDRHHGHAASYDVVAHGLNCRMDELRAALGLEQLKKLARNNARRRGLAREYHRLFESCAGLRAAGWRMPPLGVEGDEAAHHLMAVLAPSVEARADAMARLRAAGIQSSIHYPFIPEFSAFRATLGDAADKAAARLPLSRAFCQRELTLPLHPLMSEEDVQEVMGVLGAGEAA